MTSQDGGTIALPEIGERLLRAAVSALEGRRPQEALPSLDRLRRLPGQRGVAAALRAEAMLALSRPSEADAAAEEALAESPDDAMRLELRARAHMACGRRLDALDTAAAAVVAAPGDIPALLLFGTLLMDDRRFDDAVTVLEDARSRRPGDARTQLCLGIALTRAGRAEAAQATLDACMAQAPGLPGLALARAQAALARKCHDEAIAIAQAGLAQLGGDPALYSVMAHALEAAGRPEEAWAAFRTAARLAPDDPYLAHLVATADGAATERASAGYVTAVFDGYAANFEASLIRLNYRVPGLVRRALERQRPGLAEGEARLGPVLDLGCGTGLVGVALQDLMGDQLVGIDLSPRMLQEARAKRIYDSLVQGDILEHLDRTPGAFDVIVAADVFCYVGVLDDILRAAARRLAPDGLLVFSVERGEPGTGHVLHRRGRYTHAPDLVSRALHAAGLAARETREEDLRTDFGSPVAGLFVVAAHAR